MDMSMAEAEHQVPHSLTARRGGQHQQAAQTIKTQIVRGDGVVDITRRIVDRQCEREAGL